MDLQEKCWTSGDMKGGPYRLSRPGSPTDNAIVESFNGRLRQECLNENWFMSLEDARRALDEKKTYDTWQQGLLQIFAAVQENKPFILNVYRCEVGGAKRS